MKFPSLFKVKHSSTQDKNIVQQQETEWANGHGATTWATLWRFNKSNLNACTGERRASTHKKPRDNGKFCLES